MASLPFKDSNSAEYDHKAVMDTIYDPKNKELFEAMVVRQAKILQKTLSSVLSASSIRKSEMDYPSCKDYHDDEYDPMAIMYTYNDPENKEFVEALVIRPTQMLRKAFSTGLLKGGKMIDLVNGPNLAHLFVFADYVKEIIILDSSDASISEIKKWLKNDQNAVDWSHAAKHSCEQKGGRNTWEEEEKKLRKAVTQVLKCDFSKDKLLEPMVLDPVNCVFSAFYLESVSKDRESYISNLKKVRALLNVGGYLVMFTPINMTFYKLHQHKFFVLSLDSNFVNKAITEAGFSIVTSELYPSGIKSHLCDQSHINFVVAVKK
ncbi:indolethylamine N-methyltransferase-like [Pyxicephalus adspersus]|uniref:indolethylamine N-methyltransferase-like n=1 Tax=Pyxicephalus adspersus TaxID=30357 RepID=UPI003B5B2D18